MKFNVKFAVIQELKEKIWSIILIQYALRVLFSVKNAIKHLKGKYNINMTVLIIWNNNFKNIRKKITNKTKFLYCILITKMELEIL